MKLLPLLAIFLLISSASAQTTRPSTQPASDQAALEKQLAETLSNATLVGHFTVDGAPSGGPLKEDRYTLGAVKKLSGDNWLLPARIGGRQMTVPLVLPIQWAGDTPVIMVTNFGLPGMGSYTARVILYADHYAGFWSAGPQHQGTMYGRIEHTPTTQPDTK